MTSDWHTNRSATVRVPSTMMSMVRRRCGNFKARLRTSSRPGAVFTKVSESFMPLGGVDFRGAVRCLGTGTQVPALQIVAPKKRRNYENKNPKPAFLLNQVGLAVSAWPAVARCR